MTRVLIIDDNIDDREALSRYLKRSDLDDLSVQFAEDGSEYKTMLAQGIQVDCILLDYSLPGRNGVQVLEDIIEQNPHVAIIMITGQGNEDIAVKALKSGAQDYVVKGDLNEIRIGTIVANAVQRSSMAKQISDQQVSLEAFARVLAHDLRAPLRALQEAVEMLVEDLPENVAVENSEMLGFITTRARRMEMLIMTLQKFNEVGTETPTFHDVDLRDVLNAVNDNIHIDINETNATINLPDELPRIHANAPLLVQLFQNIFSNSIKYNTSGAPRIDVVLVQTDTDWRIEVTDDGIGIEEEYLNKIFDPFWRAHGASAYEGTGLGLATCKKILDTHQGKIWCHSKLNIGSKFTILLPKNPEISAEIENAA